MNLVDTEQKLSGNQEEIEKLRLENVRLRKQLDKEEFHHKALFKQFNELNAHVLAKERELDKLSSKNVFYKYAFYVILFLLIPAYYFISNGKSEKFSSASQAALPALPVTSNLSATKQTTEVNQTQINNPDTAQLLHVKPETKPTIQPDTARPKMLTVAKPAKEVPATQQPFSDSARNAIYWEGWNAYYGKSPNPYKGFPLKSQAWLQGWKAGENDEKKLLVKDSLAH